jgi:hypothetical protein
MSPDDFDDYIGEVLYDRDGTEIGPVVDLYVDDRGEVPQWITVSTGNTGTKRHFVPIDGISPHADGLMAPYPKDVILGAPHVDAAEELDSDDEVELYDHYDLGMGAEAEGYDDADLTDDPIMTRSEEDLETGRMMRETGKPRLRKYIVTEVGEDGTPTNEEVLVVEDAEAPEEL